MMLGKFSLGALAVGAVPDAEWNAWKQEYGKVYNGVEEEHQRRQVFHDNLLKATELQKLNPLAQFGSTKFSDWTTEEFKSLLNSKRMNLTGVPKAEIQNV